MLQSIGIRCQIGALSKQIIGLVMPCSLWITGQNHLRIYRESSVSFQEENLVTALIRNWRDQYGRLWPRWRIQRALKKCLKKNIQPNLNGVLQTFIRGVMVEELLTDNNNLPNDWKVHVFNGKAGFIQYDTGRMTDHSQSIYA